MRIYAFFTLLFLLVSTAALAVDDVDYLAMMAEESEIKAIAVVTMVQTVSNNSDGSFKSVTFKRDYALSPYTPNSFVGGCKTIEQAWQQKAPGVVYFKPRKGQKVYVTISTNGGAITSYTPMNAELDHVVRKEPHRLAYHKGRANIIANN